jgi:hypothetical protein
VSPGASDAECNGFDGRLPCPPDPVVGHCCIQARRKAVKRPGALQARELGTRIAVGVLSVDRTQQAATAQ